MNFYQTPSAGNTYLMFSYSKRAELYWRVSARYRKSRLGMRNFTEEHPHVIENV